LSWSENVEVKARARTASFVNYDLENRMPILTPGRMTPMARRMSEGWVTPTERNPIFPGLQIAFFGHLSAATNQFISRLSSPKCVKI
jgi:hypothetical protein